MMSSVVTQLVDRRLHLLELEKEAERKMPQSTADFFTVDDRRELIKQGVQMELVLKEIGQLSSTTAATTDTHGKRIRSLEDDMLTLRTEIRTAAATSKLWIGLISGGVGLGVSLLMKLIWK